MDRQHSSRPRGSGQSFSSQLFEEDFDRPPPPETPPEPEIIEPVYSAAELAAARAEAWREGHDTAQAEAHASDTASAAAALRLIAEQVAASRAEAAIVAEQESGALAGLLMDCLGAAFPVLCAAHGEAELLAIMRILLPALTQEQRVVVRIHPDSALAAQQEIERLDPDLLPLVELSPAVAIPRGDIRVAWRGGGAVRDCVALWNQIAGILAPAGLLPVPGAGAGVNEPGIQAEIRPVMALADDAPPRGDSVAPARPPDPRPASAPRSDLSAETPPTPATPARTQTSVTGTFIKEPAHVD